LDVSDCVPKFDGVAYRAQDFTDAADQNRSVPGR